MYLCRHATGTIADYVKQAIELGLTQIGFTDHAPWTELIDRSVRMSCEDYPIYIEELEEAIKKYSSKIKILKGVEIEYFKYKDSHYRHLMKDLDYMILGQHYIEMNRKLVSVYRIHTIKELTIYKNTLIEAMRTGFFKFIAHPDLFLFSQKKLSSEVLGLAEEIILAAKRFDIPLEVNANGIRKGMIEVEGEMIYRYPRKEFWELVKKHEAKVVISSDAHKPELLFDEAIIEAVDFCKTHNLTVEEELVFDS
ncbi:MAG: histidinol-phosphatase [Bacilli bacterium]|nr:histidinol-phosphatase [Bacilli bacterium]